jgi:hypothetical protein
MRALESPRERRTFSCRQMAKMPGKQKSPTLVGLAHTLPYEDFIRITRKNRREIDFGVVTA